MIFGPFFGLYEIPEKKLLNFGENLFFLGLHLKSKKKLFNFWWRPFFCSSVEFEEKNSSIFGEELFF